MTYVTCPTMRYHPAVVAQKAATMGLLSDGRFTLGLGAGENLNEHVVGRGWPPANVRHEMLAEALEIITGLFDGGYVNYNGEHFRVDSAKLWDLPEQRVPIGVAVSGDQSIAGSRRWPTTSSRWSPRPSSSDVGRGHGPRAAARSGRSRSAGTPTGRGRRACARAVPLVRRRLEGQRRAARPGRLRRRHPVRAARGRRRVDPLRTDLDEHRRGGPRRSLAAGFTDVALVQIGDENQEEFFPFAEQELLPALREALG